MPYQDGLVQRALSKTSGAKIHDVKVLIAYYRNVSEMLELPDKDGKHWRREMEQEIFQNILEIVANTGNLPKKLDLDRSLKCL